MTRAAARGMTDDGVGSSALLGILPLEGATKQKCGVEDESDPRKAGNHVGERKCSTAFSLRSRQENGRGPANRRIGQQGRPFG